MGCDHSPEMRYSDWSQRLHTQAGKCRIPIHGSVELTARCNLRCVHCFINQPVADRAVREHELSFAEWARLIDEIVAAGCLWLLITGGEPLVRPDFLDIYTYAKKRGLLITLFTNGTLITPEIADHLARWRPFSVEITLYGHTRETYEAVTGVPGSFERCRRGIQLLLERNLPLTLKTMLLTMNASELDSMRAWAQGLGVDFRHDPMVNARLDGSSQPCGYRLPPEQLVALDLADKKSSQHWRERFRDIQYKPVIRDLFRCGAGWTSFHIGPAGIMSLCITVRQPGVSLSRSSFKAGWEEVLLEARQQQWPEDNPCVTCAWLNICDQCPGWGMLEQGIPGGVVEYVCRTAHLRAAVFGAHHHPKEAEL
ncbi:MAG: hypothetical protein A2139_13710 [Desulfobacca sp. RBG_16_60_12]|nr:MAG: hypothetical protein A2139_13710 [Desulfobacca sp. RBG_16_60_12]